MKHKKKIDGIIGIKREVLKQRYLPKGYLEQGSDSGKSPYWLR